MKSLSRVVISQRVIVNNDYNEVRDALSHEWWNLLYEVDIIPIPVPNRAEYVDAFLNEVKPHMIILSGGNNISPERYNGLLELEDVYECRDETESRLIEYAVKNTLPVLGVCRGMQMLQVYFGGKLRALDNAQEKHIAKRHTVTICEPSFLNFKDKQIFEVNSYHKYGMKLHDLSSSLRPFALSEDRVVEGFYHQEYPIIGIQWHPEREGKINEIDKYLFIKLIEWRR